MVKENNIKDIAISIDSKIRWNVKRSVIWLYFLNISFNISLLLVSWFEIIASERTIIFTLTLIACLTDIVIWSCIYIVFLFFSKSHLFKKFKYNMNMETLILDFLFVFFLVQLCAMAMFTYLFTVDISNNYYNPTWLWFFIVFSSFRTFQRFRLLSYSNKRKKKTNHIVLSSIILWNNLSFFKNFIIIMLNNKTYEFHAQNIKQRKVSGSSLLDNLNALGLANIIALIINLGLLISKSINDDVTLLVWICYETVLFNSLLFWWVCTFNIKFWFYNPQEYLNKILDNKNIILNLQNLKEIDLLDEDKIEQVVIFILSFITSYFDEPMKFNTNYNFKIHDFIYENYKILTLFNITNNDNFHASNISLNVINHKDDIVIDLIGNLIVNKV